MEFYGVSTNEGIIAQSFNSQRDGILQNRSDIIKWIFIVSIPNGMEFYFSVDELDGAIKKRFNSQRDRILPGDWVAHRFDRNSFNSQRDGILRAGKLGS